MNNERFVGEYEKASKSERNHKQLDHRSLALNLAGLQSAASYSAIGKKESQNSQAHDAAILNDTFNSISNKENSLIGVLTTGSEFSSNGINYVVISRENGRENRRRSQLLLQSNLSNVQAGEYTDGNVQNYESIRQTLPMIVENPQQLSTDWNSASPMKRSEISIRELEFARSQANSTE